MYKRCLTAGLLALLVLFLAACSGSKAPDSSPGAGSLNELPAPAELPRTTSAKALQLVHDGLSYEAALPNSGTSPFGATLRLLPQGRYPLAYAMYAFNLTDYTGDNTIHLKLAAGSAASYLGLANRASNRWEWHPLVAGSSIELETLTPYSPDGAELIACVVSQANALVEWVCVGSDNVPGELEIDYVSPTTAGANASVSFSAGVRGQGPLNYYWTFPEGFSVDDSESKTPHVTFPAEQGSYTDG